MYVCVENKPFGFGYCFSSFLCLLVVSNPVYDDWFFFFLLDFFLERFFRHFYLIYLPIPLENNKPEKRARKLKKIQNNKKILSRKVHGAGCLFPLATAAAGTQQLKMAAWHKEKHARTHTHTRPIGACLPACLSIDSIGAN